MAKLEAEKTQLKNQIAKLERSIDKLSAGRAQRRPVRPARRRPDHLGEPAVRHGVDRPRLGRRPAAAGDVQRRRAGLRRRRSGREEGQHRGHARSSAPHMAEARITSDDATNPLMPGDRILQPGVGPRPAGRLRHRRASSTSTRTARDDLEKLKAIIAASNGVVDAGAGRDGQERGRAQGDTRYLVLGEYPERRPAGRAAQELERAERRSRDSWASRRFRSTSS